MAHSNALAGLRRALQASSCLVPVLLASPSVAGPQDPRVVGGSASVATGVSSTTITQGSQNAIIDWRTFNIPAGHTTTFVQPNAHASVLNRVTGREGPSQIHGTLNANGRVFIVNPDGILFGQGARVNVGSLLATTHDVSNQDFMAGRYRFIAPGNPSASVVNEGTITAASGGFAALVAPGVRNSGTINARLGTAALAAGGGVTLDFYGDQLVNLRVNGDILGEVTDVATGQVMPANVSNTGKLKANGGTVQLSATTARKVVDSVINNTGIIEANTVRERGGRIILGAATAQSKTEGAPSQTVRVSGRIAANGRRGNQRGGEIRIAGEQVALRSARVEARGKGGGGTVLVGGDLQGGAPKVAIAHPKAVLSSEAMPTARQVVIDPTSTIDVSATGHGDGGKLIVWSDQDTKAYGSFLARGGSPAGAGGFAEISSRGALNFAGLTADLTASNGKSGTLLFDPTRFIIGPAEAATIARQLNQGIRTVILADDDIRINSSIIKTAGPDTSLEFYAGRGIHVGPGVVIGSQVGRLNLRFEADMGSAHFFTQSISSRIPTSSRKSHLTEYIGVSASDAMWESGVNFEGQHISTLIGDYYDIRQHDVFVHPTSKIFTNGGTLTAWGANYFIEQQIRRSFSLNSAQPDNVENEARASSITNCLQQQACGYNWFWSGVSDTSSRLDILGFHVGRRQTGVAYSTGLLLKPSLADVANRFALENPRTALELSRLANITANALRNWWDLPIPLRYKAAASLSFSASVYYHGGDLNMMTPDQLIDIPDDLFDLYNRRR